MAEGKSELPEKENVPREGPRAEAVGTEGNDAVCFTAGLAGAAFGAGTIHAYLSADRDAPRVAAGISMGALNAAALQRVYRELHASASKNNPPKVTEAARWQWFRQYVEAMVDRPLNVFWDAIPDQSDFFADMIPIHDTSTPPYFQGDEMAARRDRYLLVKLGRWLARSPVKVSQLASAIVNYVRIKEKYPLWEKIKGGAALARTALVVLTFVVLHGFWSPEFFPEHKFQPPREAAGKPGIVRRALHWLRARVFSWLNMFSLSVVLAGGPLLLAMAYLLEHSAPQGDLFDKLKILGIGVGVAFLLNVITARYRKKLMESAAVQKRWMPILAWGFSVVNLLLLAPPVIFEAALKLHERYGWPSNPVSWTPVLVGAILAPLGLIVMCLLFSPLVLFPEPRQWLQANGFLRRWPRPLFGWGTFCFLGVNVLSLTGFLGIGLYWIREMAPTLWKAGQYESIPKLIRSLAEIPVREYGSVFTLVLYLVIIPVVPVVLGLLAAWAGTAIGNSLRGKLAVSMRIRAALLWTEGIVISGGALLLAGWACKWLLNVFVHKVNATHVTYDLFSISGYLLAATWVFLLVVLLHPWVRSRFLTRLLARLALSRKLINDYYLRLWLSKLFEANWKEDHFAGAPKLETLNDQPFPVVLVVAPLQTLLDEKRQPISARQLWANKGTPLVAALRTALAVPFLFEPTQISFDRKQLKAPEGPWKWVAGSQAWLRKKNLLKQAKSVPQELTGEMAGELRNWMDLQRIRGWADTEFSKNQSLDLVDGSVVRKNPLQSLFGYLSGAKETALAMEAHNDKDHPAIHVVYNVPLSGAAAAPAAAGDPKQEKDIWQRTNVVENGLTSLRLSARRDTKLEVEQTNMMSLLETVIRKECGENTGGQKTLKIFADQIAPEKDFEFSNPWNPNRKEILEAVAAGCRGTLQVLYKDQLASGHGEAPTVHCPAFLAQIAKPRRMAFLSETPGLTEVCQHCSKELARPTQPAKRAPKMLEEVLAEPGQLASGKPRIVFVASGGVFRGAFHIGMIATMQLCEIRPDLIVGASVGTLMGGALGATFAFDKQIPARLVDTFLRVDETVALTRTLKSAARELGIRGRAVKLSPRAMRRMVLRGSRSDPGFAAAGAPPALIDAITDLFMIPLDKTKDIAGKFISGKVTGAMHVFIEQLRTETIRRLDIERAVIGTSLLEPVARQLLAADHVRSGARQPFLRAGIAYFGTTTNLVTQSSVVLGGEEQYPGAPYDYVEAALASSAFPAVFAPRQESNVYPGCGNADTLFADGGLFDNLPFFPAIGILARGQRSYRVSPEGKRKTALVYLGERLEQPDLLLAGALNAVPERKEDARRNFDTIKSIDDRASSLQDNVKIRAFEFASRRVYGQLQRFHRAAPETAQKTDAHFVDGVVNAAVLPVFPASADHLNGTFAFCKAMKLDAKRVCTSIADGCYQTLRALSREQAEASKPGGANRLQQTDMLTAKSVIALVRDGRIPKLKRRESFYYLGGDECPFFEKEAGTEAERREKRKTTSVEELKVGRFRCPFAPEKKNPFRLQMKSVFLACKEDSMHWNNEDPPSGS